MNAPVYVKVDHYKKVQIIMEKLEHKLSEAKETLKRINELKKSEDEEVSTWQGEIAKIESKMAYLNEAMKQ